MAQWDNRDLEDKVDTVRDAMIHMVEAIKGMMVMVVEHEAHLKEHHEVLNDQAKIVQTLEELIIGGPSDEPTP